MSTYSDLSEKRKKVNIESAVRYNREKAKRISLKMGIPFYNALMAEIEKSGKSMNGFILDVLKEKIGYIADKDTEDAEAAK